MESDMPSCSIKLIRIDKTKVNRDTQLQAAATEPTSNPPNHTCDVCTKVYMSSSGLRTHRKKHSPVNKRHKCGGSCPAAFYTSTELKYHRLTHTGEKPHSCSQCESNFSLRCNLRRHIKARHGSGVKSFGCWCGAKFKTADSLRAHNKQAHGGKRFPCGDCDKVYGSKLGLEYHVATAHTAPGASSLLECKICNKEFAHRSRFLHHQRQRHESRTYSCTYCSKSFTDAANLRRHVKSHVGEKPYSCSFCSKCFVVSRGARLHERRMHTNEKPFPCDECDDRAFCSKDELQSHRNHAHIPHTQQQQFVCGQCDRTYFHLNSFRAHERAAHQKRDDKILQHCDFCPYATTWASNFKRHVRTHTGEKSQSNPCSICGKHFSTRGNLKQHLATHAQDRNFPCGKCAAKFKTQSGQQNHIRLVHNVGKVACQLCPKVVKSQDALLRHIRTHTGEKPFACGKCDKRCLTASDLKARDQVNHTDQNSRKTYNCDICCKEFASNGVVRRHQHLIHAAKRERFHCEFCEKSFSRKDGLQAHLRTIRTHTGEN